MLLMVISVKMPLEGFAMVGLRRLGPPLVVGLGHVGVILVGVEEWLFRVRPKFVE